MKIHTIIIDDELSGVRSLEIMLQKFVPEVKIVATSTEAVLGVDLINDYRPDLVFLDINMPVLNGFDLLEKLQFTDFQLIFSTAYQEYGLKALKQNACDYLLKPISLEELQSSVKRVQKKILEKSAPPDIHELLRQFTSGRTLRVPLPNKAGIEYVWPDEIMYIEAASNHSRVTLVSGGQKSVNQPLKDYETLLCNKGHHFMRIQHSFMVNLHYVVRYLKEDRGYVVMQDKTIIPVSKDKKDEFLRAINLKAEE